MPKHEDNRGTLSLNLSCVTFSNLRNNHEKHYAHSCCCSYLIAELQTEETDNVDCENVNTKRKNQMEGCPNVTLLLAYCNIFLNCLIQQTTHAVQIVFLKRMDFEAIYFQSPMSETSVDV